MLALQAVGRASCSLARDSCGGCGSRACRQARTPTAGLMLCIGSSLDVYPAAGLPELTLAAGGALAIVTRSTTPYDHQAAVRLGGDVEEELEAVVAVL
jgi:NAD-dependent SIR2 family protein deacetylase